MEDLNNVPSTGTFGNSINQVNQNFGLVKGAIENVEGRTIRSKGLFPTQAALTAAYPSPKVGDYAYVGSGLPATVYDCLVEGTWHNTGQTGGSETVDLSNYSTKSETSASVANSLAQATARTGYGEATASNNAYSVSIANYTLPTNGGVIRVKMPSVATGAATLDINSTGAKTLWYNGKAVSSTNTWESGEIISVFYDGTKYMSSNSQGGGGDAEKIKYNNSQSGLASNNVQGALDEVASATKEIQERMTNELSIPIGGYPSCGGYINGNSFVSSTKYYGILVPFSEYIGKKVRFKKRESASFLRYAFLTQPLVSGQTVSFCSGETVKTISKDSIDVTVPSDCNYVYIYVYSDGDNYRPTLFELQDVDIKELANDVITLNEKVGDEELDYLIIKSVKGSEIPSGGGFVNTDGTFKTNDSRYYGGFIDVSEYRGKKVKITAGSWGKYRYAFCTTIPTSATSTSILCSGCSLMTTNSQASVVIPNDCNGIYIYLYANGTNTRPESVAIHEDTSITTLLNYVYEKIEGEEPSTEGDEMDMGEYNPSVAEIFNYYFAALTQEQQSTLLGLDFGTITQNGLTLPSMSFITHNKLTAFSDEKITLEVRVSTLDKIMMYSSTNGALNTSEVSSYILFDFVNGRVSIFRAGTMTSSGQGTELCGVDFNSASGDYILTIGRKRRNVFASIYNKSTRILNEIVAEETSYPSVNTAKRPAGWMYKEPSFMTIAGTPIYKRFSCNVKGSLFMMFQGDSYTEGYAGFYPNCWAYKAARYFKNSRTCGLSGHKLADMITQYHDSIKGKINISVMVISIGINDMSDLTSDAKIAAWANTYKSYLDELVEDGIIPIVNRIWPEGSNDSATSTKAKKMNDYIRSWGFDGADFGAVNGYTSNSTYYTSGHLTAAGNDLTYQIFINELSKYKNN